MGCVSRIFVWTMIVLIPLFTVGIGLYFVSEALSARNALATGPAGTFTPVEQTCNRGSCFLEGTFTSDDGTITREGVVLRDSVRISSGDPMPSSIDDVHLDAEADGSEPVAYTADYSWLGSVLLGAGFAVAGPAFSIAMAVGTRRYQARAIAAHGRRR